MPHHSGPAIATALLLSLATPPLSAQYVARITLTGGPHAGAYTLTPPTCALVKDSTGGIHVSMVDPRVAGRKDRVASFTFDFADAQEAAAGTRFFRFAIGFGSDAPAQPPTIRYNTLVRTEPPGSGKLTFNFVYYEETFQANIAGTAMDGTDSVHVSVYVGCKGVNRAP